MAADARSVRGVHSIEVLRHTEAENVFHLMMVYFHTDGREGHLESESYLAWRTALEAGNLLANETQTLVETLRLADRLEPGCSPASAVTLRAVDDDNVRAIVALQVTEAQDAFVARNVNSLAQAYAAGDGAWVRAIYADEVPVGFVMLSVNLEKPRYYLWRYMVDRRYQGMGFGRQALERVVEYVRTLPNANEMFLSYVPGEGSPKGFYEKLGFRDTGVEHGGELEMRLDL
jgi:diamine N-acetyltransferase